MEKAPALEQQTDQPRWPARQPGYQSNSGFVRSRGSGRASLQS
jgi:hypothetical protein